MAKFDISALKSRLEPKASQKATYSNERYIFWEMGEEDEAHIRFLPDKNPENPWFLQEYKFHDIMVDGKKRSISCLKNYGEHEKCPLCDQSQEFYNSGEPDTGKKWYRKLHWLAQVVVMKDPLPNDPETGKNSKHEYRTVALSKQVYDALINSIRDDMDASDPLPQDYDNGRNFILRKQINKVNLNGRMIDQANYSRSKFDRKNSALPEELIEAVSDKIVLLTSLMPNRPDLSYVESMINKALGRSYAAMDDMDDDMPDFSSRESKVSKPSASLFVDDDEDDIEEYKPARKTVSDIEKPKASVSKSYDFDDDEEEADISLMARINAKNKGLATELD